MTADICKNGAIAFHRMNVSGYFVQVTIFSWMFTIACCLVVGLGFGLDLVFSWLMYCSSFRFH